MILFSANFLWHKLGLCSVYLILNKYEIKCKDQLLNFVNQEALEHNKWKVVTKQETFIFEEKEVYGIIILRVGVLSLIRNLNMYSKCGHNNSKKG